MPTLSLTLQLLISPFLVLVNSCQPTKQTSSHHLLTVLLPRMGIQVLLLLSLSPPLTFTTSSHRYDH